MKKLTALFLTMILVICLAACGGAGGNNPDPTPGGNNNPPATKDGLITDGSKLGVVQNVPGKDSSAIESMFITTGSGQHDYIKDPSEAEFERENLNSEYELNEWIDLYMKSDSSLAVSVYFVRNDKDADYSEIKVVELEAICSEKDYPMIVDSVPDIDNYGFIGSVCVHPEATDADLFNAFFVVNGKVDCMVQLSMVPEHSVGE